MACSKFMKWLCGPNSWLCKTAKICCCPPDPPPPEYVDVDICTASGRVARGCCHDAETVITETFLKGEEPTVFCPLPNHQVVSVSLCKTSGDLANQWCEKAGTVETSSICAFKYPSKSCAVHTAPVVVPKIPEDMTVRALKRRFGYPMVISQFLIPSFWIENEDTFDEEYIETNLLNRVAANVHANAMRAFSFGGWEPETLKMISFPWKKEGGSFKLVSKNPAHLERVKRRLGWCIERRITPIITITDNCSTHVNRPGFWSAHGWNGSNNINGTSTWQPSIYHFYEPEHQDKPGMKESAKWIQDFIRWIVREIEMSFSGQLMWEICNEGLAGHDYHLMVRNWMKEEGVEENWRVMTSLDFPYWDSYKKLMSNFLSYSIHGVQSIGDYEDRKQYFTSGVRFLPSEDGRVPLTGSNPTYAALVKKILEDGNLGFESNSRPYFYDRSYEKWIQDTKTWSRMKAISDGWKSFLDSQ